MLICAHLNDPFACFLRMLIIFYVIYTPLFLLLAYITTRNLSIITAIMHKKSAEIKTMNSKWISYGYLIYYYWLPVAFIVFLIDVAYIFISGSK